MSDLRADTALPPDLLVRLHEDDRVDEVIVGNVHVHVEQMDHGAWWIGLSAPGSHAMVHLDFTTTRNTPIHLLVRNEGFPMTITQGGVLVQRSVADVDDDIPDDDIPDEVMP